jgi:predicted RNase H-like nuclease
MMLVVKMNDTIVFLDIMIGLFESTKTVKTCDASIVSVDSMQSNRQNKQFKVCVSVGTIG